MKKSTILLLCAATLLFCACNQDAPVVKNNQREVKKLVLSPQDEAINVHQNEFTLNLLKQVNANEMESENVFLSPLSVSILCGMLTNGAGGNTLSQILSTIGAGDFSVDDLNNYYHNFISCVTSLDSTTDMNIADAIWVDDQCHVKEPFVEANKTYYFAAVENLDLQSQKTVRAINDWADENTKGLVQDIIKEPFSDACRMVLTNAIYFKGLWKDAFKMENTRTEPFNLADGTQSTVKMMNQMGELKVTQANSLNARMLRLYFKEEAYCVDIVLPNEGINCDDFLAGLTEEKLAELEYNLCQREVQVKLPKFGLKYHCELNKDMQALGMTDAFSDLANFSGMAKEPLFISRIFQDAALEVDEAGAKAAAVTVAVATMDFMAAEPDDTPPFIADRPFLLFIRECKYGTILFAGKIGHPESK